MDRLVGCIKKKFLCLFQQLRRQLASSEEKIQRLQHQYQMKHESTENKLAQLQEEYLQIQSERDVVQAKIDENKRIVDSTERKACIITNCKRLCCCDYSSSLLILVSSRSTDLRASHTHGTRNVPA